MGYQFLLTICLLALASTFTNGFDPSPLQDFCVAVQDTKSAVFVNGLFCKDPNLVTSDDFSISGLLTRRNTSNFLGTKVTFADVNTLPGLNTLGITMVHIDFAPGGVNPPHIHPRAGEILLVLEGTVYVGFVTSNSNPNHRLFTKILHPGDAFVFPVGLIHFQINLGKTHAVAVAALSSQNPGVISLANAVFGAEPMISDDLLSTAFQLDKKVIKFLQGKKWENNG